MDKNENIMGYLELDVKNPITGLIETINKPIKLMNDVFINYTFENPEHWEALRE